MIEANKIYNCDCRTLMDEISRGGWVLLPDGTVKEKVDLIITDPPYLISYKTCRRKNKEHKFCSEIIGDNDENLISSVIEKSYNILKEDSAMYMFCGCDRIDFFKIEIEKYFKMKNIIIWDKGNWTAGDLEAQYGKQYEMICYCNKGRAKFNDGCKRYSDIWSFNRVVGKDQIHQNQKPLDLIERMILQSTNEGDLILDPFSGSGSVAIACRKNRRNYVACELDKEYYDLSVDRMNKYFAQTSLFWE